MANESANKHDKPFLTDVKTLRERARQHIREGAVTESYAGNTETACKILNEALATELVCVLRYKRHYFMAKGIHSGLSRANSSSMPPKSRHTRTALPSALFNWGFPELLSRRTAVAQPFGICRGRNPG